MGGAVCEVSYKDKQFYLHALVSADYANLDESLKAWADIAEECRKRGYYKLVIEEDIPTALSTMDIYKFAKSLPLLGFNVIRLAFIDRDLQDHEGNLFGENVAINHGIRGKVCKTLKEAEEWLQS